MGNASKLVVVVAVIGLASAIAHADEEAAAEAAFLNGKALMKEGKTAEACVAFAESLRLDPQFGTQYNLALCLAELRKHASAWKLFRDLAQRDPNESRRKDSARRAEALFAQVSRMLIIVGGDDAGVVVVTRDGVDVTRLVGVQDPIDPGTYRIEARASGYRSWSSTVEVAEDGAVVTVEVPALEPDRVALEPDRAVAEPTGPKHRPPRPARRAGLSLRRKLALGAAGIGLIGIGGGLYFGNQARSSWSEATSLCGPDVVCDDQATLDEATALVADGRASGNVATALVAVGVVAAAGAIVLWVTDDPARESRREIVIAPQLGAGAAGIVAAGAF